MAAVVVVIIVIVIIAVFVMRRRNRQKPMEKDWDIPRPEKAYLKEVKKEKKHCGTPPVPMDNIKINKQKPQKDPPPVVTENKINKR